MTAHIFFRSWETTTMAADFTASAIRNERYWFRWLNRKCKRAKPPQVADLTEIQRRTPPRRARLGVSPREASKSTGGQICGLKRLFADDDRVNRRAIRVPWNEALQSLRFPAKIKNGPPKPENPQLRSVGSERVVLHRSDFHRRVPIHGSDHPSIASRLQITS